MKYFIYELSHDRGKTFQKTNGSNREQVIKSIEDYELCPRSAIKIKEVPLNMFSFPADVLWKLYDKPYKIYTVNRRAVDVLAYVDSSARVRYRDTGQECTVSRNVLKSFTPKTKK